MFVLPNESDEGREGEKEVKLLFFQGLTIATDHRIKTLNMKNLLLQTKHQPYKKGYHSRGNLPKKKKKLEVLFKFSRKVFLSKSKPGKEGKRLESLRNNDEWQAQWTGNPSEAEPVGYGHESEQRTSRGETLF